MFRHIRYKLIAAFALPLLILVGVAGLEVSSSVHQISTVNQETSLAKASVGPGGAVQALQTEREDAVLSVLAAANNLPVALQGVTPGDAGISQSPTEVRVLTDSALSAFRATVVSAGDQSKTTYQDALGYSSGLDQARAIWSAAGTDTSGDYGAIVSQLYSKYTTLIDSLIDATSQVPFEITDPTLRTGVEALVTSLQKTEADWRVTMDLFRVSWSSGAGKAATVDDATKDLGADQGSVARLSTLATGPFTGPVDTLISSTITRSLGVNVVRAQQGEPPLMSVLLESFDENPPVASAQSGNGTVTAQGNGQIASVVTQRATQLHNNAIHQAGEFGLAGLIGTILGLLLVSLVSRSISRPLVRLAQQADQLATEYLPATLQAIMADEAGGVPDGLPITVSGNDEVSEVARALDAVQKTAIELGAGQVVLRRNLSDAFVNLGRRNQNLVTSQLEYISDIELKEADPDSLEELFRLDHLATRMRRNAESLLILAGSGPARQWTAAVPAMDVARAASAEVEDYKRLRLHHFDPAMIKGEVTTDLVHILAELTENALTFSPPGSPVDVYGRFLDDGYVLVIVDAGIGMSVADLDIANQRLEGLGSEGDVPGRYLGHFVAGRLAARHDLSISLQASHSGGLVARVRIPGTLIEATVADLSAAAEVRSVPEQAPRRTEPPVIVSPGPVDVALPPDDAFTAFMGGPPPAAASSAPRSDEPSEAWYMNFTGPAADDEGDARASATEEGAAASQEPGAPSYEPGPTSYNGNIPYGTGANGSHAPQAPGSTGTSYEPSASYGATSAHGTDHPFAGINFPDNVTNTGVPDNNLHDNKVPSNEVGSYENIGSDVPEATLEKPVDDAHAWSAAVAQSAEPGPADIVGVTAPVAPLVPPTGPGPADHGWDPLAPVAPSEAPSTPAREPVAGPAPMPVEPAGPYAAHPAVSREPSGPQSLTEVASMSTTTRSSGTPDLGILSPLAGTVPAGGLLAWAQAPPPKPSDNAAPEIGPVAVPTTAVPPLSPFAPGPATPGPATPAPAPVPAPAPTASWDIVAPPTNDRCRPRHSGPEHGRRPSQAHPASTRCVIAATGRLAAASHPDHDHPQPVGPNRGFGAVLVGYGQRRPGGKGAKRTMSTDTLSNEVKNFNWMLDNFVESSAGVCDAVAVSSDGLLMAMSHTLDRAGAERVAAIISGMVGLSRGAAKAFGWEPVRQIIVAMEGGYLFLSSISDGSNLGVLANAGCDIGLVGYQTNLLLEKIGALLTPALIAQLRAQVLIH